MAGGRAPCRRTCSSAPTAPRKSCPQCSRSRSSPGTSTCAARQAAAAGAILRSATRNIPRAIRDYGPENLGPGDVLITNEPFPSGVHLNDVSLISPVFAAGELLGYVANLTHHVDVGGGAPASVGSFREVFQDGVIVPPVK